MPLGHVEVVNAVRLLDGLSALARIVHTLFKFVARHSCVPFDEIDDPGEKNRCAFINLCQMLKVEKTMLSQAKIKVYLRLESNGDGSCLGS